MRLLIDRWIGLSLLAVSLAGCDRPPLTIHTQPGAVVVDVRTFGEFSTSVSRVRLQRGDVVLWDVEAVLDVLQLHSITLEEGSNRSQLPVQGQYRIRVPPNGVPFQLETGVTYTIEVWGESHSARASFEIPAGSPQRHTEEHRGNNRVASRSGNLCAPLW